MKLYYCPNCRKEANTRIISKEETLKVKGKSFTTNTEVRICNDCGEEIYDDDLDSKTLLLFYDLYRESEGLLTTNQIIEIRKRYRLSQASFSKILGFGEKTITRYENGAIQDISHDNLIRFVANFDSFVVLFNLRKNVLTQLEIRKIEALYNKHCNPIKGGYTFDLENPMPAQFGTSLKEGTTNAI